MLISLPKRQASYFTYVSAAMSNYKNLFLPQIMTVVIISTITLYYTKY